MSDVRIQASVVIREVLDGRTYKAELPNGKLILAYAQPLDRMPVMKPGDNGSVLLSLCDFNEGRLVPEDLKGIRVENPVIRSGPGPVRSNEGE
ncbi:MAG: hypothetical protein RL693_1498 [Verrucomicrobiota bacterium]|jgi:hypothetical protein